MGGNSCNWTSATPVVLSFWRRDRLLRLTAEARSHLHSLAVQFELQEVSFAPNRGHPLMQDQLGAEVYGRKSYAGDDEREYKIVKNHLIRPFYDIEEASALRKNHIQAPR